MTTRTWLGFIVLIGSVALGIDAYYMYRSGLPGSPKLEQGIRLRVLSPADVRTSTNARFVLRGSATRSGELELRLGVVSAHPTTYLVLQLGGGAVSTDLHVVDDLPTRETSALVLRVIEKPSTFMIPEYRKFYDLQLVVVRINREATFQRSDGQYVGRATFRIQMRDPAVARENARYVAATPTVMRPRMCQGLDAIERDEDTAAIDGDFLERGGCADPPADAPPQQTVTLASSACVLPRGLHIAPDRGPGASVLDRAGRHGREGKPGFHRRRSGRSAAALLLGDRRRSGVWPAAARRGASRVRTAHPAQTRSHAHGRISPKVLAGVSSPSSSAGVVTRRLDEVPARRRMSRILPPTAEVS
jgi:hypothetical protein